MERDLVSIIIRTKDEEKWISSCLNGVFEQDYTNIEVVVVDNESTDKTIEKLKDYDVKLFSDDQYLPGRLLNEGIRRSKGEYIVCLSGHCIPVNHRWLSKLLQNFDDPAVGGVYGRQIPLSFTPDSDKRDLVNTFRSERIVQTRDSFFHNANSMIRRTVWEQIPFDETVTNIEDRLWGKAVIERGLKLVYEPEAGVYHYHGIHQNGDEDRCRNVVRILEELDIIKRQKDVLSARNLKVMALVPVTRRLSQHHTQKLLNRTLRELNDSSGIHETYVLTDNRDVAAHAEKMGAIIPFLRPKELSSEFVTLAEVYRYALDRLEEAGVIPDLIALATITYPFRPKGIFNVLINEILASGMDTVVASYPELRTSWINDGQELKSLTEFMPRAFKNAIHIGMVGLGCVTHPFKIREEGILSGRVGIYELADQVSSLEVRTESSYEAFARLIEGA
jgi:GT2 family glycosyltransferase